MSDELIRQSIIDEEHLKLLALGYMIATATTAFSSLFGLVYVGMGILLGVVSFLISRKHKTPRNKHRPPLSAGSLPLSASPCF